LDRCFHAELPNGIQSYITRRFCPQYGRFWTSDSQPGIAGYLVLPDWLEIQQNLEYSLDNSNPVAEFGSAPFRRHSKLRFENSCLHLWNCSLPQYRRGFVLLSNSMARAVEFIAHFHVPRGSSD